MIVTITSHGKSPRDVHNLAEHLSKASGQKSSVVASFGLMPDLDLETALGELRRSLALSVRARIGFHHVSVNPSSAWTAMQRDEAVRRILVEIGALENAWILVEHAEKKRAMAGGHDRHWHLVVAHIDHSGRALDVRSSFARLEAVARTCEHDFGEPLTVSRRTAAVAGHLKRMGRADVIAALASASKQLDRPRSAMSSAGRQRAARDGIDLPALRAAVRAAWQTPNLVDALALAKLRLGFGDHRPVPVVKTVDGQVVGALDRLAGVTRAETKIRLEAEMAKRKIHQGGRDDRKGTHDRGRTAARPARKDYLARRGGDQGDGGDDSGTSDAGRGVAGPRFAGADRGQNRHAPGNSPAAQRRSQRSIVEIRSADAAARRRAGSGRSVATDVEQVKAAMWRRLFGADLSPALVAALFYVDVQQRLIMLTRGGWVRDEGDRLLASGSDPKVVAMLVEAAKAKGWRAVEIWGDEDFLREARRQFEAVGIAVTIVGAPPHLGVMQTQMPRHDIAEILAIFRRRRATAETSLTNHTLPASPLVALVAAQNSEREATEAWRVAIDRRDLARLTCSKAKQAFERAGLLGRRAGRRSLMEADAQLEIAQEAVREAADIRDAAMALAKDIQYSRDKAERQRRAASAEAERRHRSEIAFYVECESVISQSPEVAAYGVEAIEAAARERIKDRATQQAGRPEIALENDALSSAHHP